MDWDQIAEDWAAMTRRLGNSGLHAPGFIAGPKGRSDDDPQPLDDHGTAIAAQAIVTVARQLAGK